MLCLLVNIRFQVLFHSPPGVLFNFPSRYYSTIGHQVVFSLTGWSPHVHTRFHVSCTTLDTTMSTFLSYTGLSPSMACFPVSSTRIIESIMWSEPQKYYYLWFRLFLFRSPLLKESIFLSFPVGTKMFQFPTFPSNELLYSFADNQSFYIGWVSPFRNLRIKGYLLLPEAYRSLSRLSSALGAKSFTLCS